MACTGWGLIMDKELYAWVRSAIEQAGGTWECDVPTLTKTLSRALRRPCCLSNLLAEDYIVNTTPQCGCYALRLGVNRPIERHYCEWVNPTARQVQDRLRLYMEYYRLPRDRVVVRASGACFTLLGQEKFFLHGMCAIDIRTLHFDETRAHFIYHDTFFVTSSFTRFVLGEG